MTGTNAKHRVGVGRDPFVLRSALVEALADDGRFEVTLCPRCDDAVEHVCDLGADAGPHSFVRSERRDEWRV